MAKYRKISPRIWNDAKFRALSDNAKLVFFMLLTHPQTSALGTLRAFPQGLAPEMGWTEKAFREAFGEALNKGMIQCSEKDGLIWLPNFMRHNLPESPNVLKSWAGALDECPECSLKNEIFYSVKAFAQGLGKAFAEAFAKAFQNPSPNQEQEQEYKNKTPNPASGGSGLQLCAPPGSRENGTNPRARGTNPRAQGTNPRATGKNPGAGQARFVPPAQDEVAAYCAERENGISAQEFCDFYASKGWMVGKNSMKDWRAAVRTWENERRRREPQAGPHGYPMPAN